MATGAALIVNSTTFQLHRIRSKSRVFTLSVLLCANTVAAKPQSAFSQPLEKNVVLNRTCYSFYFLQVILFHFCENIDLFFAATDCTIQQHTFYYFLKNQCDVKSTWVNCIFVGFGIR
jgi:hypothetical protein